MEYSIQQVPATQKREALALYHALVGSIGCAWNLEYPGIEDIEKDIQSSGLYGVYAQGRLVAVASAGKDEDLAGLECWDKSKCKPCDLARIGVLPAWQNQGIARMLVAHVEAEMHRRGHDSMRLLVSRQNPYAIRLYQALEYTRCGEAELFGIQWYCYEKSL